VTLRDLFPWGRKSASTGGYDLLRDLLGSWAKSNSGKSVTTKTAIEVSTVFACCRVIGNGMAQVPFKLMRESGDGKRRVPAKDHPLYSLLARRPNPWQTSFEFRETLAWHLELCFRAYVFVNRVRDEIVELIPFDPDAVRVERQADYSIKYFVRADNGQTQEFPQETIWHLRGPSWNGYEGIEFLKAARHAIGLAASIEEAQAGLYKNGMRPSGAWVVPGKLDQKQYDDLRAWIVANHVGAANAEKPLILDREAKWQQTTVNSIDAQTREMKSQQVEEVCRYFGVMPIMVGYSDKAATYASAEQMFLSHRINCLAPRWKRFEESADATLLSDKEIQDGYYFDFVEEGMIAASAKDKRENIVGLVNGGLMYPNEGRALYELDPDPNPDSNKLRIPVNSAQQPPKDTPPTA
jgi:HK97 family phage portal protein